MDFTKLKEYMDNIDKNIIPSSRIIVKKNNKTLFEYFSAREDVFEEESKKELYYLFSLSKVITCTGALRLLERGLFDLEDPVSKYLPEFETLYCGGDWGVCHNTADATTLPKAKNQLLIKHLFTMASGYSYDLGHPQILKMKEDYNDCATTRQVAGTLAKVPLWIQPGENFRYGLSHDILAAVCEVVTGKSFYEFLKEEIFEPLNMNDTFFLPKENDFKRMHRQYNYFAETNELKENVPPVCIFELSKKHLSGGAGIVSTLKDYSTFADCLATGKSANGYVLLKEETLEKMITPALCPAGQDYFSNMLKPGYSYGLGVWTHVNPDISKVNTPIKEFGWDGAAGSLASMDKESGISVVYMQHVLMCNPAKQIHNDIKSLAFEIANS